MDKFTAFLESLKTSDNIPVIESIHRGYSACFEVNSEEELTWKERRDMEKTIDNALRSPGLNEFKYPLNVERLNHPVDLNRRNRLNTKPARKGKYTSDPKARELWLKTVRNLKGRYNWNYIEKQFRKDFFNKYGSFPSP